MRQELAGAEELVHELIARLRSQRGELRDARAARAAAEEAAAEVSLAARASPTSRGRRARCSTACASRWRRRCAARCTRNRNGLGTPTSAAPTSSTSSRRSAAPRYAQRQGRLAEWEKRVATLLAQQTALTGGGAAAPSAAAAGGAAMVRFGERGGGERPPILAELASLLQEAAADHAKSLATLDAELRAAEAIERESYERRLALAHSELAEIAQVRVDHRDQARALGAAAAEKRVDQLNDQLAEAFGLRDESVTALCTRRRVSFSSSMRCATRMPTRRPSSRRRSARCLKGARFAAALLTEVGAMREVNAHWRAQLTAGVLCPVEVAPHSSRAWRSWLTLVAPRARAPPSARRRERQRSLARSEREKLSAAGGEVGAQERRRREQVVEADEAARRRGSRRCAAAARQGGRGGAGVQELPPRRRRLGERGGGGDGGGGGARRRRGRPRARRRRRGARRRCGWRWRTSEPAVAERGARGRVVRRADDAPREAEGAYPRASGEEAAGLAARVAEPREGSEAETAARLRGLTVRCADQQEQLDEGRTALRTTREELAQERAAAREAQLEAEARHASLEEHVASMHAASWALQKQKMVRVQQLEAHNQRLKADVGRRALAHVRARGLLPCWRAWLMLVASGRETRLHLRGRASGGRRRRRRRAARAVVGDAVGLRPWRAARRARRRAANLGRTSQTLSANIGCGRIHRRARPDLLAGPSYAAGNHRARQPMLGAGLAHRGHRLLTGDPGALGSAATPYQYNAINLRHEPHQGRAAEQTCVTLRIIDTSKKTPGKPNGFISRWYHE